MRLGEDTLLFADIMSSGWVSGALISRADAGAHIDHHLGRMDDVAAFLVECLREPKTTEQAIAEVSRHVGLTKSPAQYWLAVTTVKGYLSDLLRQDLIAISVCEHAGYWARR